MATASFTATASLIHNNLVSSPGEWLACLHNSLNAGAGKLMLHSLVSGQSKDGPEINQATSVRFLEFAHGTVLCVSSSNGTQIYDEDASTLLFYAPIADTTGSPDIKKCHQGACSIPSLQHIVIGTSKGSLVLVHAAGPGTYAALPESPAAGPAAEISDVCFSPATESVFSAHSNGEIRLWAPSPTGPYTNTDASAGFGQAPVRILAMGARLLVAYGPGTVVLFDALSRQVQAELTAHARWLTAVCAREELGQVATVGEDTVLNVWQIDPGSGQVGLQYSSIVADKLLTGVALTSQGVAVSAYDTDEIYRVEL